MLGNVPGCNWGFSEMLLDDLRKAWKSHQLTSQEIGKRIGVCLRCKLRSNNVDQVELRVIAGRRSS